MGGGGGKGGTTTSSQTVSIPPEVLARYNAVNARAEETAQQPFQQYGGEFVAGLTPTQVAGTNATNAAAGQAQPYYSAATQNLMDAQQGGANYLGAATGQLLGAQQQASPYLGAATTAALAGAQAVDPAALQVQRYMNPYTRNVVGATQAAMGQQFGQQQAQQQSEAIRAGAFGGERAGLQRAQLMGQQGLAQAQAIAPLYQQGYSQALQTAQQQQGVGLGAAQANRQALQGLGTQLAGLGQQQYAQGAQTAQQLGALGQQGYTMGAGTAQQLAGLGTGAQQAALQGAQAQMAAGQVGQQTQQAQDTAQYQQFLQERGYPFQVAQFLANIAMGTGALSGSTTSGTQTSPGGFFSDKRLKNDVKEIGETHDGQPIYSYKYNGDDRTQIGLMAQDVEKKHPEAVGLMGGYKTVDYKKATEGAERTHKDMGGGLVPDGFDPSSMGGAVTQDMAGEGFMRGGYVAGGLVDSNDWSSIVAANKQALGMYGGAQPMGGGAPGATGIVPAATIHVPKPIEAAKMSMPAQRPSGISTAFQTGRDIASTYKGGKEALLGSATDKSSGLIGGSGSTSGKSVFGELKDWWNTPSAAQGGLIVPRHAYADGGGDYSQGDEAVPYDPSDVMGGKDPMESVLRAGSQHPQQLKAAQLSMGSGGQQGGGLLGAAKDAAGLFGTAKMLGEGASWLGDTALPFLLAANGGRIPAYADGGLVPRQGYATQGATDVPADYSPEADMPSPNAQEAGLVVARPVEAQPDWRVAADEAAKRAGIDPRNFARVIQAESGFKPHAVGDENSSAGLLQMHIAGASEKYPHAGLGDAYLAAKNPELAKTGTPEQKIAYLKDPANQADILDYGAQHVADKGYGAWTTARQMGLVPGSSAPVPPGLVGAGMQPAAPTGAGEKKGLGDVVTSEGFLVPALGFLGSMLASNRPNLGQALGEGIMGGVGAYQQQRRMAADIPKVEAQTELEKANVGHVNMVTRSLRAGMLVPTWQQGVGMTVFDKENPYAAPMRITDKNGIPLPGHEQIAKEGFDQLKQRGEGPAGTAGAQPSVAPVGDVTDIAKIIPKPTNANSWNPTTKVPENFMPENQGDLMRKDYVTGDLTPRGKAALDEGKKITSELREKALTSEPRMIELKRIIQEYDSLPKSGFLTTGAGASERNALIGRANVILKAIGGTEIDPNAVGAAEAAQKGTFSLGSTVANSIGTREPGYIVAQSVKNSPGIEMSKKGFDLVSSGLEQNAEYAKDRSRFYNDYFNKFHHIEGADIAFEHANPAQMYADRAMLNTIPENERADLRNYVTQNRAQFPTAVANNIRDFERVHGRGTAKLVLGSK